jgi:uncharacterized membrane protein YciS (DUF1049 family)
MSNGRKGFSASTLIAAILLISAIAGMVFYYYYPLNSQISKITSLNKKINSLNNQVANLSSQISNLENQVANLGSQAANLTSANLVTALGIVEIPGNSSTSMGGLNHTPVPYNYLFIQGSVTNTGKGTALNAGLKVVAYSKNGTLEINMTVPLSGFGNFGTDSTIDKWISSAYGNSSLALGFLSSGQTANVDLNIFHEGTVSIWTVTPVWWTYSP